MKFDRNRIGDGVEEMARWIACQIVDLSGYDCRTEFRDFAPLAIEYLARTEFVLQTAAVAWARGLNVTLAVSDEHGNDVTDERPFKAATLDALEAIGAVLLPRTEADALADIPPGMRAGN